MEAGIWKPKSRKRPQLLRTRESRVDEGNVWERIEIQEFGTLKRTVAKESRNGPPRFKVNRVRLNLKEWELA